MAVALGLAPVLRRTWYVHLKEKGGHARQTYDDDANIWRQNSCRDIMGDIQTDHLISKCLLNLFEFMNALDRRHSQLYERIQELLTVNRVSLLPYLEQQIGKLFARGYVAAAFAMAVAEPFYASIRITSAMSSASSLAHSFIFTLSPATAIAEAAATYPLAKSFPICCSSTGASPNATPMGLAPATALATGPTRTTRLHPATTLAASSATQGLPPAGARVPGRATASGTITRTAGTDTPTSTPTLTGRDKATARRAAAAAAFEAVHALAAEERTTLLLRGADGTPAGC
ncbi:Protein of unknown function [Gryllus bimaculatus]|nr:Protein of unknown function [Gryllus bimaculatus]